MKKLTKLGISPEKIMKNEELINLKGGYGENWCCFCNGYMAMGAQTQIECTFNCIDAGYQSGSWQCDATA